MTSGQKKQIGLGYLQLCLAEEIRVYLLGGISSWGEALTQPPDKIGNGIFSKTIPRGERFNLLATHESHRSETLDLPPLLWSQPRTQWI